MARPNHYFHGEWFVKRLPVLKLPVIIGAVFVLTACPAEMWIPVETVPRQAVPLAHVQYLETQPDRPYIVVGIITPEPGAYDTEAQAVKAMRNEAAKHGADAIFIESKAESGGWRFSVSPFGGGGGSTKDAVYRAKAIVWK